MTTPPTIVFVDVETTGLDSATHEVWEIALIVRTPESTRDVEHHWYVKPKRLNLADANALQINRFYERTKDFPETTEAGATPGVPHWSGARTISQRVAQITAGAVLVGSNSGFDADFLTAMMRGCGLMPAWHYRPIDVAALAYGYELGRASEIAEDEAAPAMVDAVRHPRISSTKLAALQGVPRPTDAHTALADTRWARDWYDALVGGAA